MSAYLLLLTTAFGGQAALVVPVVPVLLSAGVLAARGDVHLFAAVVCVFAGVAAGDFLWYRIGRRGGGRVLSRICRRAIEPDTCVRRTENWYARFGARTLLFAKFIPGLSTVALPLAGVFRMRPRRFLLYDACGALLWTSTYALVGYFSAQHLLEAVSVRPRGLLVPLGAAALAAYFLWKLKRRRALLQQLQVDRMEIDELKRKLDAGERIAIVDLRHPLDFESDPYTIPGALYIPAEDLDSRHRSIPRDREVALYCTCPDEVTSAREALRLRQRGVRHVRPLKGGLTAWRDRGYPVTQAGPVVPPDRRLLNML